MHLLANPGPSPLDTHVELPLLSCVPAQSHLSTTFILRQTILKRHFPTVTRSSVSSLFNKNLQVALRLTTVMKRNPENAMEIPHYSEFLLGNAGQLQVLK